ncbi:MAG TPA: hypothetical protein DHS57_03685 [Erysipelotrichaceae bacterium]|nr:hypothetical protein [Erysipelotrichaceae bacterium]
MYRVDLLTEFEQKLIARHEKAPCRKCLIRLSCEHSYQCNAYQIWLKKYRKIRKRIRINNV